MINILLAVTSGLNFLLAWFIYQKNSTSLNNRSFALLSFCIGLWTLLFIPYNTPFIFDSLFWIKSVYLAVIFLVGSMINFSYTFPYGDKPKIKVILFYFLINLPIIYTLCFTDLFIRDVTLTVIGPETAVGSFYPYGALVWGLFGVGLSTYNLICKYYQAKRRARFQILYLLLGLGGFGGLALVFDGVVPLLFHTTVFFSLSGIFSLIFVGLTAYTINRHRMFDVSFALQHILTVIINSSIVALMFMIGAISYWKINQMPIESAALMIITGVSFFLSIIFNKIWLFAKSLASIILRQPVYNYENTLLNLSLELSSHLNTKELAKVLSQNLIDIFGVDRVAVSVLDLNDNLFEVEQIQGFNTQSVEALANGEYLKLYFKKHPLFLGMEELKTLEQESSDQYEKSWLNNLYVLMDSISAALVVPVIDNGLFVALIIMGHKVSGDPFTVQDLNLLNTLTFEAATAFANSRLNQGLELKVQSAISDLQAANTRLKELDALKNDFVSVAAHELRTPMTAIRSYAWMALNRPDVELSEKMKKYLSRTLLSTERLINLVNDMLNISRIESGKIAISPVIMDLTGLVQEVLDEVKAKAAEKNIHLLVKSGQSPKVFADPDKVHQVLLNLIGNALKFTPEEGSITVSFFSDGHTVETSITDTGVGISPDDMNRLFKKFARLDHTLVSAVSSNGTGLGLYISKILVELMHGQIRVKSDGIGRGSTFIFCLPVANAQNLKQAESFFVRPKEVKNLEPTAV